MIDETVHLFSISIDKVVRSAYILFSIQISRSIPIHANMITISASVFTIPKRRYKAKAAVKDRIRIFRHVVFLLHNVFR